MPDSLTPADLAYLRDLCGPGIPRSQLEDSIWATVARLLDEVERLRALYKTGPGHTPEYRQGPGPYTLGKQDDFPRYPQPDDEAPMPDQNAKTARLSDHERHDIPPDLGEAIQAFLGAGRKYREFLKRHYPDRLRGVIYAENEDGEAVLYAEGSQLFAPLKEVLVPKY